MDDPPTDPRVIAMFAVLFGKDWENLKGDIRFEKGPVDSWVNAVERMMKAADAIDPIRVAIRGLMQEDSTSSDSSEPAFPSRAGE